VLKYAVLVIVGFHLFVLLYEEPTLRDKFGAEYGNYCKNVRRWWPRMKAWEGQTSKLK
jgi:protein-S-isoprenylcysteine O-methyltransferase Ste14